jgi:hypothetical protein
VPALLLLLADIEEGNGNARELWGIFFLSRARMHSHQMAITEDDETRVCVRNKQANRKTNNVLCHGE